MSQQEELKALQVDMKHQLDLYQGGFDSSLSLGPDINSSGVIELKRKLPEWAWIAIFTLSMTVMYSVYGLRFKELHQEHQDLVEQMISQINQY